MLLYSINIIVLFFKKFNFRGNSNHDVQTEQMLITGSSSEYIFKVGSGSATLVPLLGTSRVPESASEDRGLRSLHSHGVGSHQGDIYVK